MSAAMLRAVQSGCKILGKLRKLASMPAVMLCDACSGCMYEGLEANIAS
jgi:hypothetical protein